MIILKDSLIVYENEWLLERVYQVSDSIRNVLTDQTLFESRCIKRLGEYLNKDKRNIKNRMYLERIINEVAKTSIKRNKNENYQTFSELLAEDSEGKTVEFDPIDVLADVESEVIKKETATMLAQGDCRKKKIVELWIIGNTNNAYISRTLARSFGGNEESHRKYIQRFQQSGREFLEAAI